MNRNIRKMEQKKKRSIPLWALFILCFALIFSLVALVFSLAALGVPIVLIGSFDKFIAVISIILALIAASSTVFSIAMSHDITLYRSEIAESRRILDETNGNIDNTMRLQLKETITVFSSIESIAGDQKIYIRLAKGRLLCQSKYSDKGEKKEGISNIQAYYTSAGKGQTISSEDYEILYQLKNNPELDDEVRNCAETALNAIQNVTKQNSTPNKTTKDPSNLISKLMGFIRKLLKGKSGQQ